MLIGSLFLLSSIVVTATTLKDKHCQPNQACWPKASDVAKLYNDFGGYDFERVLYWSGGDNPPVSGVPVGSPQAPNTQPLYGIGANLSAVY